MRGKAGGDPGVAGPKAGSVELPLIGIRMSVGDTGWRRGRSHAGASPRATWQGREAIGVGVRGQLGLD